MEEGKVCRGRIKCWTILLPLYLDSVNKTTTSSVSQHHQHCYDCNYHRHQCLLTITRHTFLELVGKCALSLGSEFGKVIVPFFFAFLDIFKPAFWILADHSSRVTWTHSTTQRPVNVTLKLKIARDCWRVHHLFSEVKKAEQNDNPYRWQTNKQTNRDLSLFSLPPNIPFFGLSGSQYNLINLIKLTTSVKNTVSRLCEYALSCLWLIFVILLTSA